MFGFLFRKNKIFDRKRPDFYEGIVTKDEYASILKMSEVECLRIGKIASIQAGTISVVEFEEGHTHDFQLDNLVRKCHHNKQEEWSSVIKSHFSRFPIDKNKAKFLSKDFEYARPLLKVLVRNVKNIPEGMIYRRDIPETSSFLILDYDERFHFLMEKDIQEWEVPKAELFDIALANSGLEKIDIQEILWAEKFELFSFFSGDFSASFLLELSKNAPFTIGRYGAVVAIPTKGSAFVHPLNEDTALGFIHSFDKTFATFHKEDEVSISEHYYWFYNGKFELFPIVKKKEKLYIELPKNLQKLLVNS